MTTSVDIDQIYELLRKGEHLYLECKLATNNIPNSFWETYSAFANTYGGTIILGIHENLNEPNQNKRFEVVGVENAQKLHSDLWNILNNPEKVSINVLKDEDISVVDIDGKNIIVVRVPQADYNLRPIFIGNNPLRGSYRRNHEGDYKMKRTLINMMLRDANPSGNDGTILFHFTMDDIDAPTLRRYRTRFNYHNAEHPWSELSDIEFLTNIGGYAVDRHTSKEGLTIAGLMMFGKGLPIREKFDNLRMDYIDYSGIIGDQRYSDRLTYDGRWENNLFNFMSTVVPKLTFVIPRPFQMEGIFRNDDTIQHKAVREAFTNMIIHSDFLMNGLIRVKKYDHSFELTNPGLLKLPIEQIYRGGESKARNQRIQNMLRMIGYGENIGSGFPLILKAWADKGWERPVIIEQPDLDQTTLVLTFTKSENILHNRTENALKYVLKELTDRQRIIIDHISRNALITTDKLSVQTGVDARTIRRDIKDLRDKGILQREGGRKNGHWVINIP